MKFLKLSFLNDSKFRNYISNYLTITIFAETSSNGIFAFLKITNFDFTEKTKNQWLISRCRKSLKSKSVKWIISIFAAMWSPVVVERSPTGNLTNGRLITIICRGGFRVYFHICQQNKLLLLLRLPRDIRWLVLIPSHPSSSCQDKHFSLKYE